jgi:hypothetical protein
LNPISEGEGKMQTHDKIAPNHMIKWDGSSNIVLFDIDRNLKLGLVITIKEGKLSITSLKKSNSKKDAVY